MARNIVFTGNEQREPEKLYEILYNVLEREKQCGQNIVKSLQVFSLSAIC